ncbi:MAG: DUF167 domain-containing protein [Methylobacteriaceae bacterium]|nr:DUF167 domain-containing protein [Methylobacteriaceae bacterium]
MADLPWRAGADGLVLAVRLTPKGGRDAIDGVETLSDGRPVLKARVRAAPEDGKANAALVELLAKSLRIARSGVTVTGGQTSRVKTLTLAGDAAELEAALVRLAGAAD